VRSQHLPGLPVLTLDQGATIGHVRRCIVDPERKRVAALLIALPRFWGRRLLPMQSVHAMGSHAVTVPSADVLLPLRHDEKLAALLYEKRIPLIGSPVVTASGELVGTVRDFQLDQTGVISFLYVTGGLWRALSGREARVPASELMALGKDAVIATEEALDRLAREREASGSNEPPTDGEAPWKAVAGRVRRRWLSPSGQAPPPAEQDQKPS